MLVVVVVDVPVTGVVRLRLLRYVTVTHAPVTEFYGRCYDTFVLPVIYGYVRYGCYARSHSSTLLPVRCSTFARYHGYGYDFLPVRTHVTRLRLIVCSLPVLIYARVLPLRYHVLRLLLRFTLRCGALFVARCCYRGVTVVFVVTVIALADLRYVTTLTTVTLPLPVVVVAFCRFTFYVVPLRLPFDYYVYSVTGYDSIYRCGRYVRYVYALRCLRLPDCSPRYVVEFGYILPLLPILPVYDSRTFYVAPFAVTLFVTLPRIPVGLPLCDCRSLILALISTLPLHVYVTIC